MGVEADIGGIEYDEAPRAAIYEVVALPHAEARGNTELVLIGKLEIVIAEQVMELVPRLRQRLKDRSKALPVLVDQIADVHAEGQFAFIEVRDSFRELRD